MVSMKMIANKLNLSRTTVSRILNNKMDNHKYKRETIELVRETAEELGYTSNLVAKSLKSGSTKILSFLVPDIAHPTYISILKTLEKLASDLGYNLLICATEEDTEKERGILKMLQSRMVDGVIIAPVSYYESLDEQYSYPIICIDRKTKNSKYPAVLFNNEKAAYNATIAMLEKNVKKPLFIAGNPVDYSVMQRLEGFKRALQEYSLPFTDDRVVFGVFSWQTAKSKINDLIRMNITFDSIFFATNYFLGGVVEALEEKGIAIDIHTGIDNYDYMTFLKPQILTYVQPEDKMAQAALELLLEKIKKPEKVYSDIIFDGTTIQN